MPIGRSITSPRQFGFMEAAAHGNPYGASIDPGVAEKLIHETAPARRSAFAKTQAKRRKRAMRLISSPFGDNQTPPPAVTGIPQDGDPEEIQDDGAQDAERQEAPMSRLTTPQRNALPSSDFVEPAKRAYPIPNKAHARSALQLGAKNAGPALLSKIKSDVKRKFPSIKIGGKSNLPKAKRLIG